MLVEDVILSYEGNRPFFQETVRFRGNLSTAPRKAVEKIKFNEGIKKW
jgi:hypothetical protein